MGRGGMPSLDKIARLKGRLPIPVLLYLLAVMLPINFNVGPLAMTGIRLLLIVMIIPLTLNLLRGKYGRLLATDILFLLHFAWIIIALMVNNPDRAIQSAGSMGIEFIGGYVLGRAYIRGRADFIALIRMVATIAFFYLPFAIYETMTGKAIIANTLNKLPGISSILDIDIGKRMGLNRIQGSFVHPIHWGLFCSLALSLCFVGLKGIYSDFRRYLVSLVVGLSGLLALSSGALLAILLQVCLFIWAFSFRNTDKRWVILLALFAFVYVVLDIAANRPPIMVILSYATFSAHTAYWRTIIFDWGIYNVWLNPIFGIGLGDWIRPGWMYSGSVDNYWLVMGMRFGVPGFAFLAVGYIMALWKIGRRKFDGDIILWNLRRAWMFSFMGLTFTLCTVHVWHTIYSFVFFMFGAGIWMLTTEPEDATKADNGPAATPDKRGHAFARARAAAPVHRRAPAPHTKVSAPEPAPAKSRSAYTRFPKKDRP